MPETEGNRNNTVKMGGAIIGLIAIIVVGIIAFQTMSGDETSTTQQTTNQESSTTVAAESDDYENGTYEAIGGYITPGGQQEIGVRVTLTNGIIEDVEIDDLGTLEISREKQVDFINNYKPMVIGRNIDEVKLGKVSGSSLTSIGFNEAIEDIKEQARS